LEWGQLGEQECWDYGTEECCTKEESSANTNVFSGQTEEPTESQLAAALGDRHELWQHLVTDLKDGLAIDTSEWHTSSVKLGWSLRLQAKKRSIVYLGPREGWFWHHSHWVTRRLQWQEKAV